MIIKKAGGKRQKAADGEEPRRSSTLLDEQDLAHPFVEREVGERSLYFFRTFAKHTRGL
jgi:hypothetical protein